MVYKIEPLDLKDLFGPVTATTAALKQLEERLSRPLVSSGMIQHSLKVTKQGALNLISELGLREMTGRGRLFRMCGPKF